MKTTDILTTVASTLEVHGIPDHRLEAELLVGHVLGLGRASLYAALQEEIAPRHLCALERLLAQRLERRPLAYLLGHREFYGLDLLVSPAVMVPRQETEALVDRALTLARQWGDSPLTLADVGTGSGAIAVAVATHLPTAHLLAIDISQEALAVAAANAQHHGVAQQVSLAVGDLLSHVAGPLDMVLANLPYIPDRDLDTLQEEVRLHEPRAALAGGQDGLDLVRRLLAQARGILRPQGAVLLEISPVQKKAVLQAASASLPEARLEVTRDLEGWDRVVEVYTLS